MPRSYEGVLLAILQARMSSTRLPGKVLKPLQGAPMILRQIERIDRAAGIDRIVVATSTAASDDELAKTCADAAIACYRGDLDDVLARFHAALVALGRPETFLRLTADCPLADPEVIDACIAAHVRSRADYTHNTDGWTYPKGLDVEVCSLAALEAAWSESTDPYDHEHVTPFIYRRPERFRIEKVRRDPPLPYRWTVDTPQDFAFVEAVYADLHPANPAFTTRDILAWQARHPDQVIANPDGAAA